MRCVQKRILHVHIYVGSKFKACQNLNVKLKTGFVKYATCQLAEDFIATHGKNTT